MTRYCLIHDLKFPSRSLFRRHQKKECNEMLKYRNICTFIKTNGHCCKRHFSTTTGLILHYRDVHQLYACSICYQANNTLDELEKHSHDDNANLRLRKLCPINQEHNLNKLLSKLINIISGPYRCRYCSLTWPTERGKNVHETTGHRMNKDPSEVSSCNLCGKGYRNLSSLRRHLKIQHELLDNPMATTSDSSVIAKKIRT